MIAGGGRNGARFHLPCARLRTRPDGKFFMLHFFLASSLALHTPTFNSVPCPYSWQTAATASASCNMNSEFDLKRGSGLQPALTES